jgi:hypothetical protein
MNMQRARGIDDLDGSHLDETAEHGIQQFHEASSLRRGLRIQLTFAIKTKGLDGEATNSKRL